MAYQLTPEQRELFSSELTAVSERVLHAITGRALLFYLFADSHCGWQAEDVWPLTAALMRELNAFVQADGVIGLGDYIQGNKPQRETREQFVEFRRHLTDIGIPYYLVIGNHEGNGYYTRDEKNVFSEVEKYALYARNIQGVKRDGWSLNCYKDFPDCHVRFIFLKSDIGFRRNGYLPSTLTWLEYDALRTPPDTAIFLFSHMPSRPEFDTGPNTMQGWEDYERVLRNSDIAAHIHGHTHIDAICRTREIPFVNVSVACSLCRSYGGLTRRADQISAVCFDTMVLLPEERKIKLIRFGAGHDREISY